MPADLPSKIGNEITVRISLTFQEAPEIHTLLAMTPVRERGKLVRSALTRYINDTRHPAGDVEQQIEAVSAWLRSRTPNHGARSGETHQSPCKSGEADDVSLPTETFQPAAAAIRQVELNEIQSSASINRWLNA